VPHSRGNRRYIIQSRQLIPISSHLIVTRDASEINVQEQEGGINVHSYINHTIIYCSHIVMEVDSPQRPSPMTTNTTAENVIDITSSPVMPALKRKGEERRHDGKENGDGDKRVKLECESSLLGTRQKQQSDDVATPTSQGKPLVELKGKKLVYKEDAAPWSIPKRRELHIRPDVIMLTDRSATLLHLAARCRRGRQEAHRVPERILRSCSLGWARAVSRALMPGARY
jgi:hypothetical protein